MPENYTKWVNEAFGITLLTYSASTIRMLTCIRHSNRDTHYTITLLRCLLVLPTYYTYYPLLLLRVFSIYCYEVDAISGWTQTLTYSVLPFDCTSFLGFSAFRSCELMQIRASSRPGPAQPM